MENLSFQTLKQNSFHQENLLEKEQSFNQNFQDKIRFWNKLPQRSRIRNIVFKTCQVLKLKSSEARKIEGKTFSWNQWLREILLLKKHFCIILHCMEVKFCIFVPCWKTWKDEKRIRKTNSNKIYKSSSDFESSFFNGLQFWNEKLKTWPSSSQLLTTRQNLNWYSYSVLDFD